MRLSRDDSGASSGAPMMIWAGADKLELTLPNTHFNSVRVGYPLTHGDARLSLYSGSHFETAMLNAQYKIIFIFLY